MIGQNATVGYRSGVEYLTLVELARRLAVDISLMAERASAIADEVVWQATRERGSAEAVAKELGVSLAAVRKAVQQRNRRLAKSLTEGTETDTPKRTVRKSGT